MALSLMNTGYAQAFNGLAPVGAQYPGSVLWTGLSVLTDRYFSMSTTDVDGFTDFVVPAGSTVDRVNVYADVTKTVKLPVLIKTITLNPVKVGPVTFRVIWGTKIGVMSSAQVAASATASRI